MLKLLFKHALSRAHYIADALVLWCYDDRVSAAFNIFVAGKGYKYVDQLELAGGAKDLVAPDTESDRNFLLRQIETSIHLHHTKRIVLMEHIDCGAFGGSAMYNNLEMEKEMHEQRLIAAKAWLQAHLSTSIPIDLVLVGFEETWEVV